MTETVKILLVEDEVDIQKANRDYLTARGYETYCAETLETARSILADVSPDLILLDVMLPDGSGYDFCVEVRRISTVPIIFLTAKGGDGNIVGGLSKGGDDYIVKPYSLEVMGARVAAQLRRNGNHESIINLPPLEIDLITGRSTIDGIDLKLTPKENQLLAFMVENRGQVVSQYKIYKSVWNLPADTIGGTVKTHISRLRGKICLNKDIINYFDISSSGQGYRFVQIRYPAEA